MQIRVIPGVRLFVGDESTFAIDATLPSLAPVELSHDANSVLEVTEGLLTFYAGGTNVFQTRRGHAGNGLSSEYVPLSLSMFLEWVFYDEAYRLDKGGKCFSELVGGESSPPLNFMLVGETVHISWDFSNSKRRGEEYAIPKGQVAIDNPLFENVLGTMVEGVIAATNWRSRALNRFPQWTHWLHGYQTELDAFYRFVS